MKIHCDWLEVISYAISFALAAATVVILILTMIILEWLTSGFNIYLA